MSVKQDMEPQWRTSHVVLREISNCRYDHLISKARADM